MKNIAGLSDEKLVEIVTRQDKDLYAHIIKRYQERLLRYAVYLVKDESDAADVVQDTFIKAYIYLKSFNTKKKFSSWIYRIVHNEAINLVNKQKKHVPIMDNVDFDSGINLEEDMISRELKSHTEYCLKRIPVLYSEPLTLFFLEEKSYEEISDILRIPIGTVGTRINRAKIMLQKICQK
jgi:RNA polymerase sigma-70 factor (ECF subfamily)